MSEGARLAAAQDLAIIDDIADRQRAAMVDQRGGAVFLQREAGGQPVSARIKDFLESGSDGFVVVGTYDDVVFGYGAVAVEALLDGRRLARLTDFVVDADIRGSGIGEAMMNLIVEHARRRECFGIDSVALPGDRSTKNFFESFGLKARLLTVHRDLTVSDD
jgi:ribosomal protein S18 acetylase RimI-like enzyme